MIFVDTNVFVMTLRYARDTNATDNGRFLEVLEQRGDGATSVVNVLETCGILSFNLNPRQLRSLHEYFGRRFAIRVLPESIDSSVVAATSREVLSYIGRRLAFGDALIADALHSWAPETETFVSWDARHFRGKVAPEVLTPSEFLERGS